jgi:hypothetical protein
MKKWGGGDPVRVRVLHIVSCGGVSTSYPKGGGTERANHAGGHGKKPAGGGRSGCFVSIQYELVFFHFFKVTGWVPVFDDTNIIIFRKRGQNFLLRIEEMRMGVSWHNGHT